MMNIDARTQPLGRKTRENSDKYRATSPGNM